MTAPGDTAGAEPGFGSSFSSVLLIATLFGLGFGFAEGVLAVLLRGRPGFFIRVPTDVLWIAPLFDLALFLAVGLAVCAVCRIFGTTPNAGIVVALFSGLALFALIMLTGKMKQVSALLLSLGIAMEIGRRLRNRQRQVLAFIGPPTGGLVRRQFVLALAAGVVGTQWDGWRERRLSRSLPTARADSPNVILIVLDTLRADHLSCYGYARATSPNIDALARRGARFERAISNCSWTLPAHASLFTGRYLHEHGADTRVPLSDVYPTLADVLAAQGYRTAGFAANTSFVTPEWGLRRGFAHFEAYGGSLADDAVRTVYGRKLAVNLLPRFGYWDIPGRKRAHQVNQEFLDWLDRSSPQPFFAFLNYLDVHDPYLPPSPFDTKFSRVPPRGDLINFQFQAHAYRRKLVLSAEEIQSEIDGYDGCLASLDDALGALCAELARRGLDERTLVILTSDHGEAFGNHNLFGHGNSLYIETLHVPLIFAWPGRIPSGARIESVVGLQDVPPTVMELIGGTAASPFPGRSLGRLWRDDDDRRSGMVLSEVSKAFDGPPGYPNTTTDLKSLVTSEWHCIIPASGRAQLYAWTKDPTESDDLAGTPLGRDLVPEFDRTLKRLLRRPSGNA